MSSIAYRLVGEPATNLPMEITAPKVRPFHRIDRVHDTGSHGHRKNVRRLPASPHRAKAAIATSQSIEQGGGKKIILDPENVEKGLAKLVLTVLELLRQVMERQAVHRMDTGDLSEVQIEKLGNTLMKLEEKVNELREHFGLQADDLNLNLGPLGNLM